MSYSFPIQNGVKERDFYHHCPSTSLKNTSLRRSGKAGGSEIE
jgi:hypothetical protein